MINVLVVDDELLICKAIKSMIERMEGNLVSKVWCATGYSDAEKILEEEEVHVTLTDIRMPEVTGLELIKRFSKSKPEVKIIIISGYEDFQYAQEAIRLGVLDYLLKPVVMSELKEVLERVGKQICSEVNNFHGSSSRDIGNNTGEEIVDKTVIDLAKKYVNENYNKDINMAMVSNTVSISYNYFSKIFKEETGMNFMDYLMKVRMEAAGKLLVSPTNRINEISEKVGYQSPKHFTRAFKNYFGVSPKEYREKRH